MTSATHPPTHDRVLSDYLNMEVWSHTAWTDSHMRYQAVCVECGQELCDIEFSRTAMEDAINSRTLVVDTVLERIEQSKCKCGERFRLLEFDASQAAPLDNKKRGARLGPRGKLYAL